MTKQETAPRHRWVCYDESHNHWEYRDREARKSEKTAQDRLWKLTDEVIQIYEWIHQEMLICCCLPSGCLPDPLTSLFGLLQPAGQRHDTRRGLNKLLKWDLKNDRINVL